MTKEKSFLQHLVGGTFGTFGKSVLDLLVGIDLGITSYGSGLNLLCLFYTSCIMCSIKY